MSETYENEDGVWERKIVGGRIIDTLVEPKKKKASAKKTAAKKGAKKSASSK
tara:strand:- start:2624 stop:2779 length:156 start_codon:yes stop_codon:yes gene_type:complete